jgi:hypothetical protein
MPRDDAATLMQAVLERLAAENSMHVIKAAPSQVIDFILDAVASWEKNRPGHWRELGLPLPSLVEHELTATSKTLQEQTEFLCRHESVAGVIERSGDTATLSHAIDTVLSFLLRFVPLQSKPLHSGQWLSAGGQSRVELLERWLRLASPGNVARFQERFTAWKTVHKIIARLREPAEKAGRFSKCPVDLSDFADAYRRLTCSNPVAGDTSLKQMTVFLSKSMEGLKGVGMPAKEAINRWLVACLPDDLKYARVSLSTTARSAGGPRGNGRGWRWSYAILLPAGIVAAVFAVFMMWQRGTPSQPKGGGESGQKQATAEGPRASPPPLPPNGKPLEQRPEHVAAKGASTTDPAPSAKPPLPLTADSLAFKAELVNGQIQTTWDKRCLGKSKLVVQLRAPDDKQAQAEESPDDATSELISLKPKKDVFGAYYVTAIVRGNDGKELFRKDEEVSVSKPPAPKVRSADVRVEKDGKVWGLAAEKNIVAES